MLMSKSRLEKFLYALYSLDSSDLPKPLSRIEDLYNCLVTGEEVPTFEPLSRVEKYLMAILGGYDVNSLPNPLSRVEVLLYKLATGDDNLDDVKSFLSEHEELLADIIRNGGVGGDIDIEYVLYTLSTEFNTLYNTAEKPVKSAILKGDTLVNVLGNYPEQTFTLDNTWQERNIPIDYTNSIKPNTTYTFVFNVTECQMADSTKSNLQIGDDHVFNNMVNLKLKLGVNTYKLTTINSINFPLRLYGSAHNSGTLTFNLMLLEGDHTESYQGIPYFEGMQSVKMPVLKTVGKNLIGLVKKWSKIEIDPSTGKESASTSVTSDYIINPIKNRLWIRSKGAMWNYIYYYDINKTYLGFETNQGMVDNYQFDYYTITGNEHYVRVSFGSENAKNNAELYTERLEDYIAPKSNILTVNEEVELRGIGDVKDELNLLTGELVQNIHETTLNGQNDTSIINNNSSGYINYQGYMSNVVTGKNGEELYRQLVYGEFANSTNYLLKDGFLQFKGYRSTDAESEEGLYRFTGTNHAYLYIKTSRFTDHTLNGVKQFLSENPQTYYVLNKPKSIKTVDSSVVDQDGNDTKLSTFNDITHVTLSSEGLIPEAEMEVATKNEEDLEDAFVYTLHTLSEEFNTLYNTENKPVKSAILKGNTLVNLANYELSTSSNELLCSQDFSLQKNNTAYTLFNFTDKIITFNTYTTSSWRGFENVGANSKNLLTLNNFTIKEAIGRAENGWDKTTETEKFLNGYMIIEGDYTNVDIPYFEGMQSVKMPVLTTTGKNLFDGIHNDKKYLHSDGSEKISDGWATTKNFIPVKPNTTYTQNIAKNSAIACVVFYDKQKNVISSVSEINVWKTFTTPSNCYFIKTCFKFGVTVEPYNFQVEEGSVTTSYEAFKSNILSTPEDLELRGIGNVKDTLNCLTGELTQRIGKIVLDGTQSSVKYNSEYSNDDYYCFIYDITKNGYEKATSSPIGLSCYISFQQNRMFPWTTPKEFVLIDGNDLVVKLLKSRLSNDNSISTLNTYLASHPITINYPLMVESIKTVDLSVVDQDGNDTKLSTFNNITHVTLSSEGLIPEAESEVAEKVTEVTASMFAISREQEVIDTTINEQSENVDSTMIATTEIYEELL